MQPIFYHTFMTDLSNKIIYKFAKLFCLASQGLVSSRLEAARILGVPEHASMEEINSAYKQKVKQNHPDLNPGVDPLKIKLINAAREIMLQENFHEQNIESESEYTSDNYDDAYPSYEDIADMRREMGREEFNKQYPGWETELQHEMGLDEYNKVFEGYDPNDNYDSYDDYDRERMWEALREQASDVAYDIVEQAKKEGQVRVNSDASDLVYKYKNLINYPVWVIKQDMKDEFLKELKISVKNRIIEIADELDVSLDDAMSMSDANVVKSFLSNEENFYKDVIPDNFLSSRTFIVGFLMFLRQNSDLGSKYIQKYKDNKYFLSGIMEQVGRLHIIKDNEDAKKAILTLPFSDKELKIVKYYLGI